MINRMRYKTPKRQYIPVRLLVVLYSLLCISTPYRSSVAYHISIGSYVFSLLILFANRNMEGSRQRDKQRQPPYRSLCYLSGSSMVVVLLSFVPRSLSSALLLHSPSSFSFSPLIYASSRYPWPERCGHNETERREAEGEGDGQRGLTSDYKRFPLPSSSGNCLLSLGSLNLAVALQQPTLSFQVVAAHCHILSTAIWGPLIFPKAVTRICQWLPTSKT